MNVNQTKWTLVQINDIQNNAMTRICVTRATTAYKLNNISEYQFI